MTEHDDPFADGFSHVPEADQNALGDATTEPLRPEMPETHERLSKDGASRDPLDSDPLFATADPEFEQWLADHDGLESSNGVLTDAHPAATIGALSDLELDVWLGEALQRAAGEPSGDHALIERVLDEHQLAPRDDRD
jgi:hypothetical protein